MVPDIAGKGHSFAGAMRYYLHDKRAPGAAEHPLTSERVAWTETRNLAVEDPHLAMRLMIATANMAEALKRQAGIKASGRRSTNAVYAFSLSWHPDEAPRLDRAEMLRAADAALAAIDASHLQCVIVCHRDQPHPHVHCIINRVDPTDGRMAVLSKDRERLSQWAHAYERERGPLLTPKRAERYGPDAERARRQRKAEPERSPNMRDIDSAQPEQQTPTPAARAPRREPSQRAVLAQLDAAQRERHAQERHSLDRAYQAERKAVLERHPSARTIVAEHRKARQAKEVALQAEHARDMAVFDRESRSLIGRFQIALKAAKAIREPGDGHLRLIALTIGLVFSLTPIRNALGAKQSGEHDAFLGVSKTQLPERIAQSKADRQKQLSELATGHGREREQLITRQASEKAKMKEAWRAMPQPERGKRGTSQSDTGREYTRDTERPSPERNQYGPRRGGRERESR